MAYIPSLTKEQLEIIAGKLCTILERDTGDVPEWLRGMLSSPDIVKALKRVFATMNTDTWVSAIQDRVGRVPISSGRSSKWGRISFDDLIFLPAQLAHKPVDYFREYIAAETIVGKQSRKPLKLNTPIVMGAMSFGALSREAKIALAKASTIAGTMENTGEGGVLQEERKFSDKLIIQYSTGRFGITEEILKKADAIEIKIGQGAKPGQGGLLRKEKITDEIAVARKVGKDKDIHSPASHPDVDGIEDLKKKVEFLRAVSGGMPIILKLGAGTSKDVELAVEAAPDIIAIDGMEGATGAAPEVMLDEMGNPTLSALIEARETLDRLGAAQELWIGGGMNKGGDFAKALALGADAVFVAFPLLVAMGCIYCRECYVGDCPRGIATQKPDLRRSLDPEKASLNIASYLRNCTEEIKMIAGACGVNSIHDLDRSHLRALTSDIARITRTRLIAD